MQLTTQEDIKQLGTILCVFAHPDDETFTMGGLLAMACANGQRVIVLTATKGEGGVQDETRWPAATLGDTRAAELKAALAELGTIEQEFLGYADGSCAGADIKDAGDKLAERIRQLRPDSIFTFGPDGMTGHPDHQAVCAWATHAHAAAGSAAQLFYATLIPEQYEGFRAADTRFNFFFNTEMPPVRDESGTAVCLRLADEWYARKIAALQAMPSQYEKVLGHFTSDELRGGFGVEAFIEAEHA